MKTMGTVKLFGKDDQEAPEAVFSVVDAGDGPELRIRLGHIGALQDISIKTNVQSLLALSKLMAAGAMAPMYSGSHSGHLGLSIEEAYGFQRTGDIVEGEIRPKSEVIAAREKKR